MEMGKEGGIISISEDFDEDFDVGIQRSTIGSSFEDQGQDQEKEDEDEDENEGIGRTYECRYCKRGFTNAQALGGHMNIHRKDKAKLKAKNPNFSSSSSANFFKIPSSCSSNSSTMSYKPKDQPPLSTYPSSFAPLMSNYQVYTYEPLANPRSRVLSQPSINYYRDCDFSMIGRSSSIAGVNGEIMGSDLSLRINSSPSRTTMNHQGEEEMKTDDIDLELRLGYD